MFGFFRNKPEPDANVPVNRSLALEAIERLYRQEMQANISALQDRRRRARQEQALARLADYWPVAVGVILSFFAPQLREVMEIFKPWGMWLVFPFVSIAERPEIYLGDTLAAFLPTFMLYAQFPLEGYMAKSALKGNVSAKGVVGQLLFFHILGLVELWLVNGALGPVLHR